MLYPKPAKTAKEQVALLKSRNMRFRNEAAAERLLENISYYRLGLYWFDLRLKANPALKNDNKRLEEFAGGVYFEEVIRRYQFDAKLRLLILQAVEKLETSLKTKWSNFFSYKYKNPLFYTNPAYYDQRLINGKTAADIIDHLDKDFRAAKDDFIIKCRNKIPAGKLPEAWIITEISDFGTFLYLILFMKKKDKQELAHLYAINAKADFLKNGEFVKFLYQLRLIRNICVHHGRLWNRSFNEIPPAPQTSALLMEAWNPAKPKRLYNSLCCIAYLLQSADTGKEWQNGIKSFMKACPDYAPIMGFPDNWQSAALWR